MFCARDPQHQPRVLSASSSPPATFPSKKLCRKTRSLRRRPGTKDRSPEQAAGAPCAAASPEERKNAGVRQRSGRRRSRARRGVSGPGRGPRPVASRKGRAACGERSSILRQASGKKTQAVSSVKVHARLSITAVLSSPKPDCVNVNPTCHSLRGETRGRKMITVGRQFEKKCEKLSHLLVGGFRGF